MCFPGLLLLKGRKAFDLVIEIATGFAVGNFFKTFIQELSKDLYKWNKKKLGSLFGKSQAMGAVRIEFKNITVSYYSSGGNDVEALFQELPNLMESIQPQESDECRVKFDESTNQWSITPSDGNQEAA